MNAGELMGDMLRLHALQIAWEGRYLDAVIFGRVESSLHLLVWIIHCAAIGVQEARRRPWFFPPKISLPA